MKKNDFLENALEDLQAVDISVESERGIEDIFLNENFTFFHFIRQIYGFYFVFFVLILISSLIPEPLIEQSHIRPMWSLVRPTETVISTKIQGLSPMNHKIRLSIRFLGVNGGRSPEIGGPVRITMSKNDKIVTEVRSSYLPPIADKIETTDSKSPFHCVFESNIVNYDTLYFRALIHGKHKPEQSVEVKWSVIRTFFASFEGTLSVSFGFMVLIVILFRFSQHSNSAFNNWYIEEKTTFWLSITVCSYDLLGIVPSFFFPSLYTLAIGEVARSALRAYLLLYVLIFYNLLLRGKKRLRAFRSFLPLMFTIIYFASTTVFLVSNVRQEIEHLWPIELQKKSPIQYFLITLIMVFALWVTGLVGTILLILESHEKIKSLIFSFITIPFLSVFFLSEILIHDLRKYKETAFTYALSNGAINVFCLLVEYLFWPVIN